MSTGSPLFLVVKRLRRRPAVAIACGYLLAVILLAMLTPWLGLMAPDEVHPEIAYATPQLSSAGEIPGGVLGRDALGRDLLSRLLWGARISLLSAAAAGAVSLLIGVTWGMVAGYFGGLLDEVMMRFVDLLYSIPFIFVVIFLVTVIRGMGLDDGQAGLWVFFVVLGLVYWLTMARVVRGEVVSLREREFVEGARALGASPGRILIGHIFPNLVPIVIVTLTLTVPRILLFEAFLSFLGLGVQAPLVSWGTLARDAFEVINPVSSAWWLVLFPSLVLAATLLALNLIGDALRDILDPRLVENNPTAG